MCGRYVSPSNIHCFRALSNTTNKFNIPCFAVFSNTTDKFNIPSLGVFSNTDEFDIPNLKDFPYTILS